MGTIVVTEYAASGSESNSKLGVANLYSQVARQSDASTSTTATSFTLNENTGYVAIEGVEDHRISQKDSACTTTYEDAKAGKRIEFGVKGGQALYYRSEA